jgi:hypothetical protein
MNSIDFASRLAQQTNSIVIRELFHPFRPTHLTGKSLWKALKIFLVLSPLPLTQTSKHQADEGRKRFFLCFSAIRRRSRQNFDMIIKAEIGLSERRERGRKSSKNKNKVSRICESD